MRGLVLSLLLITLVATIGAGWLIDKSYYWLAPENTQKSPDSVEELEKLGYALSRSLGKLNNLSDVVNSWPQDSAYRLHSVSPGDVMLPPELSQQLLSGVPLVLQSQDGIGFLYYLKEKDRILKLEANIQPQVEPNLSLKYGLTGLFYLIIILLLSLWSYPLVRHLLNLRQSSIKWGQGEFSERVTPSSVPYLKDIESEFNNMAKKIENLVADVKLLSSAVSHDLRTPIARIRLGIDTLAEEDDPEIRKRFLDKISKNVDEMTSLVETLLGYAKLEQSSLLIDRKQFNLSTIVRHSLEKLEQGADITVVEESTNINTVGDKQYISMAMDNLLQNAVRYGAGKVVVSLSQDKDLAVISVSDNGPGVANEFKEQIFKPFVKGSENKSSHGIGLATVKRITEWHHGKIQVTDDNSTGGAKFTMSLPAIESNQN